MTSTGTGVSTAHNPAKTVIPHPQPNFAANGAVAKGKKVPIKHLAISTAVKADAEYNPKASTT